MNYFKYNICFALIFLIYANNTFAVPNVSIKKIYYSVEGDSVNEIRRSLNNNSPVQSNGDKYDGYTKWYINWWFKWKEFGGQCRMTNVTTNVDVTYQLPKLKNKKSKSAAVQESWERYMKALLNHEKGHKDFGVKAAREVESTIIKMGARNSCVLLEREANQIGQRILNKYRKAEIEYDKRTQHGITQGARFP